MSWLNLPGRARLSARMALAATAIALAACNPEAGSQTWPDDHRARHPISVGRGPLALDLDVGADTRGLSPRQRAELRAFASTYQHRGEGPIGILVPAGRVGPAIRAVEHDIRETLADMGVSGRGVVTSAALQPEPGPDALVKVVYTAHVAQTNECGAWPDPGVSDAHNRSYYAFGCASQANLAAQVADPRDLVSPKPVQPPYATRRQTVLEKYGKGEATEAESAQPLVSTSDVGKQ